MPEFRRQGVLQYGGSNSKSSVTLSHSVTLVLYCINLRLHVLLSSIRLRRLNGLMWEDGRDRVDLCWEPKGNVLICYLKSKFYLRTFYQEWSIVNISTVDTGPTATVYTL